MKTLIIILTTILLQNIYSNEDCCNDVSKPLNWSFGASHGLSLPSSENDNFFDGNSRSTRLFGRVFSGKIGFSFSSGFFSGSMDTSKLNNYAVDSFFTMRKIQEADRSVVHSNPSSTFWLAGPSVRLGTKVSLVLDLQAGLFQNNPGTISIESKENVRADGSVIEKQLFFSSEPGAKRYSPGFGGALSIMYPVGKSAHLFVSGDFYKSASDISQNKLTITSEKPQQQDITKELSFYSISAGLSKSFGASVCDNTSTDELSQRSSGLPTGKRTFKPIRSPRDYASGQPTGKRTHSPFLSPRDAASGLPTGKRSSYAASGTTSSTTTSGRFSGRIHWSSSSSSVIINNVAPEASTSSFSPVSENGFVTSLFIRSSDHGSGMASGKRQFEPLLGSSSSSGEIPGVARANQNPLYNENGTGGNNPLYKGRPQNTGTGSTGQRSSSGIDNDCDGIDKIHVDLVESSTGRILSSTVTEACGLFWFDRVPSGNYELHVSGRVAGKKA